MNIAPYIKGIEDQNLHVKSIIVLQEGQKIGEHHWSPDTCRNIFSVSKSFTAMAVGMAIAEGKITLTDKVIDAFPDSVSTVTERLKTLTVKHLLTMSRGHKEFTRPDTVHEALPHCLDYDGGTVFVYDNACTFLLSAMITKATGLKVRDMLIEKLFRPLGIPDPVWPESNDGFTIGASKLELSAESLSIFGQFLLQRGYWNGKQLVPSQWIDGATRTQIATGNHSSAERPRPDWELGYGYQFWTCRYGAYRADGANGQFVIVIPQKEAVLAITSDEANTQAILQTVWDHILPQL